MSALDFGAPQAVGSIDTVAAVVVRALIDECGVRRLQRPLDADAMALRLSEDLALDSIDRVSLAVTLEDRLEIAISDGAMADVRTVGNLIAVTCAALAARDGQPC